MRRTFAPSLVLRIDVPRKKVSRGGGDARAINALYRGFFRIVLAAVAAKGSRPGVRGTAVNADALALPLLLAPREMFPRISTFYRGCV